MAKGRQKNWSLWRIFFVMGGFGPPENVWFLVVNSNLNFNLSCCAILTSSARPLDGRCWLLNLLLHMMHCINYLMIQLTEIVHARLCWNLIQKPHHMCVDNKALLRRGGALCAPNRAMARPNLYFFFQFL
jgi:hypothetical protein